MSDHKQDELLVKAFGKMATDTAGAYRKRLHYFRWLELDDLVNSVWVEFLVRRNEILINGELQSGLAAKIGYNAAFKALRLAYDGPNSEL